MLYTRKGDKGQTGTFRCDQRISKSSAIAEALGSLDEINSFLGLIKIHPKAIEYTLHDAPLSSLVHSIQETLFIIQAELAGADKHVSTEKVVALESLVDSIEKELPPITTFFISGGTELAVLCDISRTIARRAERRVVAVFDENSEMVGSQSLAYLNRLSSLLYAFARLSNHKSGIKEAAPEYR
jgi:cob(I)alamin adenosyltransferase